jgi:hypothetical protein
VHERRLIHDASGRLLGVVLARAGGFEARDHRGEVLLPASYSDSPAEGRRITSPYFVSSIRAEDAIRLLRRDDAVQIPNRPPLGYCTSRKEARRT